jgi:hypothetical protein
MLDKRLRKSADRRIDKPYQPWNPTNPYDILDPVMQPPKLLNILDSVSITALEVTSVSSVYSQTISAPLSSIPRGSLVPRGSSVYTKLSRLAPQDSIS